MHLIGIHLSVPNRNIGLGMASVGGRTGNMIAPYTTYFVSIRGGGERVGREVGREGEEEGLEGEREGGALTHDTLVLQRQFC